MKILLSVIRNRANKEIASTLNITVRTVKFHISSLLNKFGVDNRVELARRAANFLKPDAVDSEGLAFGPPLPSGKNRHLSPVAVDPNPLSSDTDRNIRFTRRQLTA